MQKIAVGEVAADLLSTRVSEYAAATERRSCQLSTGAPQEVEWGRMGYNEHTRLVVKPDATIILLNESGDVSPAILL